MSRQPRKRFASRRQRRHVRPNRRIRVGKGALPRSASIKLGLLIASVIIVLGTLVAAHSLVEQLRQREYNVARLFSNAFRYYAAAETPPDDSLYRMITLYVQTSEVPVIVTDNHDVPNVTRFHETNWNIPYDSTLDSAAQVAFLREQMREMDRDYAPIVVYYNKTQPINYVHYGNSLVLARIESLPFIQLLLGMVIVFVGYLSFSYLKRSEQSNIWVGMAKETAHQLGTPLSSLLGWSELLRLSANDPEQVHTIAGEIDQDIERLNRIAIRFSKIGSIPDLKPQNIVEIVAQVMSYFESRMPQLRKNISLELDTSEDEIIVNVNRELFEWVMENLIKNAYQSIETPEGLIRVHIHRAERRVGGKLNPSGRIAGYSKMGEPAAKSNHPGNILIDVTDTGKGIEARNKNEVFRPGYSTKTRGWGLGLSLSRRIVNEYHHGRLIVKESIPGKGTTFRIRLRG